jgi:hypothetical protein
MLVRYQAALRPDRSEGGGIQRFRRGAEILAQWPDMSIADVPRDPNRPVPHVDSQRTELKVWRWIKQVFMLQQT